MPEVAEVRLSSEFVNRFRDKIFVNLEKSPVSKVKTDLSGMPSEFTLESDSRGKEMTILFTDVSNTVQKKMKVTLGMSGGWIYYDPSEEKFSKYHKHTHLRIIDSKGFILGLYDVRRFAKWSWGDFDSRRSPCPLKQPLEFSDLLRENWWSHRDFQKSTLSEIMMSQRWFNGVGNYLRAEILYRLDRDPFAISSSLSLKEVNDLIALTIGCCNQAYKLGGGQLKDWKNPLGEDPLDFKEWMKCYGKLESIVDGSGRTFWFHEKWRR